MRHTILIIDDDARNIFALSATLRSRGYNCVAAGGAQQALAFLSGPETVDMILIDMMMPDIDGYEAIPRIREKTSVPVIAVTAQAMVGDKEKCLQAGADDYISKPVDVDKLMKIVQTYLTS